MGRLLCERTRSSPFGPEHPHRSPAGVLDGAAGHDWLGGGELLPLNHPDSPSQGFDQVFGGPGWDIVYDGDLTSNRGPDLLDGGGCTQAAQPTCPAESSTDVDRVWYYFRAGGITLNLADGGASQGESGEGDTVRGFERARTGEGADTVTGNAAPNLIMTEGGDDSIDVSGDPGNVDVVYCGAGLDTVVFDDGVDWIDLTGLSRGGPQPQPPLAPPPPQLAPFVPQASSSLPPSRTVQGGIGHALVAAVARAGRTLQRCGTIGLLRKSGCRDSFTALGPGFVVYRVTVPAAGGRAAAAAVIATGKRAIPAAGRYSVTLKATRSGRKPLQRARKLRATLTVRFTDSMGNVAKRSKKLVLRRKSS